MEFRGRSPEELNARLSSVEGQRFVPPTESTATLVDHTAQELKEKYPKRYEMYVKWLREKDTMSNDDRFDMERWLRAMNALDEYSFFSHEDESATLREKQKDVFDAIRGCVERGVRTGYVRLPTGVGKTVLFIELAEAINGKTLVVTPRQTLVDQTLEQFRRFAEGLDVGVRYTAHKDIGKQVTITTYDSLMNDLKLGHIDPKSFDLLILDEAHRGLSTNRQKAIRTFDRSFVFGFSATPTFHEAKSLDRLLGEAIYEMKVHEAIHHGLLCGASVVLAKTRADLSHITLDDTGKYDQEQLEKALNTQPLTTACVELYREMFSKEKAIVFCAGVEHAKAVATAFRDKGISSEAIWGDMPQKERRRILEAHAKGEVSVLTNVDVLTEGFDAPEVSVCMNLVPVQSIVRSEQRGGRVLRLDPRNKDKMATVVEFLHQDTRSKLSPVLFSEILRDAVVIPHAQAVRQVSSAHVGTQRPIPNISGLEVIMDVEEILRVTQEGVQNREAGKKEEKLSWDDFVVSVRQTTKDAGVEGSKAWYGSTYKNHPNWPANPPGFYKDHWSSWPELFGRKVEKRREVVEKLSWDEFVVSVRQAAKDAGVEGSEPWYSSTYKNHPNWPSAPYDFYKDHWSSWPELFGRSRGR